MPLGALKKENQFHGEQTRIASAIAELNLGYQPDEEYVIAFAQITAGLFMIFFSGASLSNTQQQRAVSAIEDILGKAQSRYIVHGAMAVDDALKIHLENTARKKIREGNASFKWKSYNLGCAKKEAITWAKAASQPLLTLSPFRLKHGNRLVTNARRDVPCPTCASCISWYEEQA